METNASRLREVCDPPIPSVSESAGSISDFMHEDPMFFRVAISTSPFPGAIEILYEVTKIRLRKRITALRVGFTRHAYASMMFLRSIHRSPFVARLGLVEPIRRVRERIPVTG